MKTGRLVFRLIEVAAKACRKQLDEELESVPVTTITVFGLRRVPSYTDELVPAEHAHWRRQHLLR